MVRAAVIAALEYIWNKNMIDNTKNIYIYTLVNADGSVGGCGGGEASETSLDRSW
jgi:hypothetical protein